MKNLELLKKLEADATPLPWIIYEPKGQWDTPSINTKLGSILGRTTHHGKMFDDAALIVVVRNTLPRLIKVVEAAKVVLDHTRPDNMETAELDLLKMREAIAALEAE